MKVIFYDTLHIGLPADKQKTVSLNDEPSRDRKISEWNKVLNSNAQLSELG